jgi:fermentation-respiration switch protein FrsA (DUF1100 family)
MPAQVRRWRTFVRSTVMAGVLGYLVWGSGMFLLQDSMIFPRRCATARPDTHAPLGVERWWVALADGSHVEAWFAPGEGRSASSPGPGVIFCHGNAERIDDNTHVLRPYTSMGVSVLLVEYPGYGRSGGEPSQQSITEACEKFYDLLAARPEVERGRIIAHGRSLGGGAVAQLAARRPLGALILESTFTSIADFSGKYLVPAALVRHPFRTDEVLRGFDRPVLIFHGADDDIVPVEHGRALAKIAPDATYIETRGGHNDYPPDPDAYWKAIEAFVARLASPPSPAHPGGT